MLTFLRHCQAKRKVCSSKEGVTFYIFYFSQLLVVLSTATIHDLRLRKRSQGINSFGIPLRRRCLSLRVLVECGLKNYERCLTYAKNCYCP